MAVVVNPVVGIIVMLIAMARSTGWQVDSLSVCGCMSERTRPEEALGFTLGFLKCHPKGRPERTCQGVVTKGYRSGKRGMAKGIHLMCTYSHVFQLR